MSARAKNTRRSTQSAERQEYLILHSSPSVCHELRQAPGTKERCSSLASSKQDRHHTNNYSSPCARLLAIDAFASRNLTRRSFTEAQPPIPQRNAERAVHRRIHGSKQEKDRHERRIERQFYEIHRTQRQHESGIEIPAVRGEI